MFTGLIPRYTSKNYGLVMSGQAASAPVTAVLTQVLNPVLGWTGMFAIVACFSLAGCIVQLRFPSRPSARAIAQRLAQPPSQL